jgi:hypothetical protein
MLRVACDDQRAESAHNADIHVLKNPLQETQSYDAINAADH